MSGVVAEGNVEENIVLFIQYKPSEKSKTYLKFEDPKECIVYIFKKCAKDLKIGESGDKVTIEYEQICDYIDDIFDINVFVKQAEKNAYKPYNREWIKSHLRRYVTE